MARYEVKVIVWTLDDDGPEEAREFVRQACLKQSAIDMNDFRVSEEVTEV